MREGYEGLNIVNSFVCTQYGSCGESTSCLRREEVLNAVRGVTQPRSIFFCHLPLLGALVGGRAGAGVCMHG